MELSEKVENIGGHGYGGGAGCGLFLMAIFLVVLFSLFRRHHEGGDSVNGIGGLALLGGLPSKEGCADKLTWSRYANFVDPGIARLSELQLIESARLSRQQAEDTGSIRFDVQRTTSELLLNAEKNARDAERTMCNIARDQERAFYTAQIDGKNERLAEARERYLLTEGRLLQEQNGRDSDRRQHELFMAMNHQAFAFKSQLDSIQCNMVSRPPFYPYGGVASINPCYGVNHVGGNYGSGNGCGSCA